MRWHCNQDCLPTLNNAYRYDVELYQRIEKLIGKKLEEFATEQELVLLLLERVSEAQRMATMQVSTPSLACRSPGSERMSWHSQQTANCLLCRQQEDCFLHMFVYAVQHHMPAWAIDVENLGWLSAAESEQLQVTFQIAIMISVPCSRAVSSSFDCC